MFLRERKPVEFQKDETNHVFQELNLLAKCTKSVQKTCKSPVKKTVVKWFFINVYYIVLPCKTGIHIYI